MTLLIRIAQGDISTFDGDAVVNAANNHLVMGSGVAGALRERGGPEIQAECDDRIRRDGPIEVGEAVATGAGRLPARMVVHAAAMGDEPASARSIRAATLASLRCAAEAEARSMAFPVLGSGIGGFSFREAARLMIDAIRSHAEERALPEVVVLYGYTASDADTLRRLLQD